MGFIERRHVRQRLSEYSGFLDAQRVAERKSRRQAEARQPGASPAIWLSGESDVLDSVAIGPDHSCGMWRFGMTWRFPPQQRRAPLAKDDAAQSHIKVPRQRADAPCVIVHTASFERNRPALAGIKDRDLASDAAKRLADRPP